MRIPRGRPRTLLVVAAVALAILALAVVQRRRESRMATIQLVNRRSAPMYDLRLIHAGGEQPIPRIVPGEVIEWRFRPRAAGKIGLRTREQGYTEFHVAPGRTIRVELKD